MSYARIVHAVFHSPWAIQRSYLGTIFTVLHSRLFAGEQSPAPTPASPDPRHASFRDSRGANFRAERFGVRGGLLVNHTAAIHREALERCGESYAAYQQITQEKEAALPGGQILYVFGSGIVGKHLSSMEESCAGGLSIDRIQSALKQARDDDKIAAVMLHLDTPGGICYGLPETAALVRAVRQTKRVAAFGDSLTASAGYGAICCADNIYVTPSADLGSIGVYSACVDYTAWCEQQGIKVRLFVDGKHKGAGYPGTSLTEEQAAKIQADVLYCSRQFKSDVRAGRDGVTDDTMQGQCFIGQEAIDAHLADDLVPDLDTALADLAEAL